MESKTRQFKLLTILFALISFFGTVYYVNADIPCGDPICIGMPEVSGDVINDAYFNGVVDVVVNIEDYSAFAEGNRREVYISYDGGTTWSDDPVPYDHQEFSPDMNEQVTKSTITVLDNEKVLITWVEMDFDPPPPTETFNFILTDYRLYYRIYNSDGTPFSDSVLIETVSVPNSNRYGYPVTLSGVRLSNGEFGVLWNNDVDGYYRGGDIFFKSYDLSGSVIVDKKKINNYATLSPIHFGNYTETDNHYDDPWFSVEKLSTSGFAIFYQGSRDEDGDPIAYVKIIDDAGVVVRSIELSQVDNSYQVHASLAALSGANDDGFAITLSTNDYPRDSASINVAMYSSSGTQIGNTFSLVGNSTTGYFKPTILGEQDGGISMVYLSSKQVSTRTWTDDEREVSLYRKRFTSNIAPLPEVLIRKDPIYGNSTSPEDVHLFIPDYQPGGGGSNSNILKMKPGYFKTDFGEIVNYHTIHHESLLFGDTPYPSGLQELINSVVKVEAGVISDKSDVILDHNYINDVYSRGVFFNNVVSLGGDRYLAKTAGSKIQLDKFIGSYGGTATYPGSSIDVGKIYYLSKNKKAHFNGFNNDGLIEQNIDIQIKVIDKNGFNEYLSPVRHLIYVGNDGADGEIIYQDGFIKQY